MHAAVLRVVSELGPGRPRTTGDQDSELPRSLTRGEFLGNADCFSKMVAERRAKAPLGEALARLKAAHLAEVASAYAREEALVDEHERSRSEEVQAEAEAAQ